MAAKRVRSFWERMGLVKGRGVFATSFLGYQRRERAPFSFRAAKDKYERCGMVAAGIDAVVERVVGAGGTPSFHLTCPDEKALKIVEDFVDKWQLDLEARVWVFEHRLYGNSFVEKLYDGKKLVGIQTLPVLTMEDSVVSLKTKPGPEKYVQQVTGTKPEWKPDEVIHFRRNPNTASNYGYSVIQPINDALDILLDAEEDMGKIIKRYAAPKIAWMLENASEDMYDTVKAAIESVKADEDYLIATLGGTTIKTDILQIDPRARFEYFINHLVNEIAAGLECPVTHLFRGDIRISDASATQMMEAFNQAIQSTQHYFKRMIEFELFKPLIEQEGLTEVPELNWGPVEEPEVDMMHLLKFVELGVIRVEEARQMLRRFGYELAEEEAAEEGPVPPLGAEEPEPLEGPEGPGEPEEPEEPGFGEEPIEIELGTQTISEATDRSAAAKKAWDTRGRGRKAVPTTTTRLKGISISVSSSLAQKNGRLAPTRKGVEDAMEKLPTGHLEGIKEIRIIAHEEMHIFTWRTDSETRTGRAAGSYDVQTAKIQVAAIKQGYSEQRQWASTVLYHEVGHHVYKKEVFSVHAKERAWDSFWRNNQDKLPTGYAKRNPSEGFAESYECKIAGTTLHPAVSEMLTRLLG